MTENKMTYNELLDLNANLIKQINTILDINIAECERIILENGENFDNED